MTLNSENLQFPSVDLTWASVHIRLMNWDISHILSDWDFEPGEAMVRRFIAKDGVEKIQMRIDLGVLQMNSDG